MIEPTKYFFIMFLFLFIFFRTIAQFFLKLLPQLKTTIVRLRALRCAPLNTRPCLVFKNSHLWIKKSSPTLNAFFLVFFKTSASFDALFYIKYFIYLVGINYLLVILTLKLFVELSPWPEVSTYIFNKLIPLTVILTLTITIVAVVHLLTASLFALKLILLLKVVNTLNYLSLAFELFVIVFDIDEEELDFGGEYDRNKLYLVLSTYFFIIALSCYDTIFVFNILFP